MVVVTSKPRTRRAEDIIRVDTWTSADPSADHGAGAGAGARNLTAPVAVYARVTRGGLPVLGARVSVRVRIEQDAQRESNGALAGKDLSLAAVDLVDDGYGGELLLERHDQIAFYSSIYSETVLFLSFLRSRLEIPMICHSTRFARRSRA